MSDSVISSARIAIRRYTWELADERAASEHVGRRSMSVLPKSSRTHQRGRRGSARSRASRRILLEQIRSAVVRVAPLVAGVNE